MLPFGALVIVVMALRKHPMTSIDTVGSYLDQMDIPAWRFFPMVGSTNDMALNWAKQGAPDWTLVVADAQTTGRGRAGRHWITEPGCALAFSLVFRLSPDEVAYYARLAALGGLGLIYALEGLGLRGSLKWPNDVLLSGAKVGGVLVESSWLADQLEAAVIGIGVNVSFGSVPPAEELRYPAIDIQSALGEPVDRWSLLAQIVHGLRKYRNILAEDAFVAACNQYLSWRDEWVRFQRPGEQPQEVRIIGIMSDGRLSVETQDDRKFDVLNGEIIMRDD